MLDAKGTLLSASVTLYTGLEDARLHGVESSWPLAVPRTRRRASSASPRRRTARGLPVYRITVRSTAYMHCGITIDAVGAGCTGPARERKYAPHVTDSGAQRK